MVYSAEKQGSDGFVYLLDFMRIPKLLHSLSIKRRRTVSAIIATEEVLCIISSLRYLGIGSVCATVEDQQGS